ncbi:DUF2946 domain-containing protein [Ramlibacter tataouinensis]|uniref:DUF2946 domain-containing protein n=1 Tax=Ramlibacter tataouinensis TaxID=94132 RepID=UPI0022F3AC60|nr:DUF2946 domain-containing protein [Ramlibacter tataouinensis]WBY00180.1 DUF2946 domain-containing protein [Ramlibacter tataouinensis]
MQRLRQARFLARLVLAWFALAIGVAIASPVAQPQALELVCSGGTMKLLVKADSGGEPATSHTLDCPLCASVAPPPPVIRAATVLPPVGAMERSIPARSPVARPAAPLPARGPPARLA